MRCMRYKKLMDREGEEAMADIWKRIRESGEDVDLDKKTIHRDAYLCVSIIGAKGASPPAVPKERINKFLPASFRQALVARVPSTEQSTEIENQMKFLEDKMSGWQRGALDGAPPSGAPLPPCAPQRIPSKRPLEVQLRGAHPGSNGLQEDMDAKHSQRKRRKLAGMDGEDHVDD